MISNSFLSRFFSLIIFIALAGVAQADPLDSDPALAIDPGSTFKLISRINIPSFNQILFRDGSAYRYYKQMKGRPFCEVEASNRQDENFGRDVLIAAGSELKVLQVSSEESRFVRIILMTRNHNFVHLSCFHSMVGDSGTGIPTIGEVKRAFQGVMELHFAAPIEI